MTNKGLQIELRIWTPEGAPSISSRCFGLLSCHLPNDFFHIFGTSLEASRPGGDQYYRIGAGLPECIPRDRLTESKTEAIYQGGDPAYKSSRQ
jgi:hypothetical protein